MNTTPMDQARPTMPIAATEEARLEAQAIVELEHRQLARDAKRSGYKPKRRRNYAGHR